MPSYLLLPAKDEAEALPWLIRRAREAGLVPVVCDDGSQDATPEVARREGALLLQHPENRGLAEALRTLFRFALEEGRSGDLFLTLDADGTMDPGLFPQMRRALWEGDLEVVVGSRYRGGGVEGLSPLRRFLSAGARAYFALLYPGLPVTDWTTGWRLYTWEFLERYARAYPFLFRARGFAAQTEMLLRASRLAPPVRVGEVGVVIRYDRKGGRSKMRLLRTAWEYLRLGWALRWERPPLPLEGRA